MYHLYLYLLLLFDIDLLSLISQHLLLHLELLNLWTPILRHVKSPRPAVLRITQVQHYPVRLWLLCRHICPYPWLYYHRLPHRWLLVLCLQLLYELFTSGQPRTLLLEDLLHYGFAIVIWRVLLVWWFFTDGCSPRLLVFNLVEGWLAHGAGMPRFLDVFVVKGAHDDILRGLHVDDHVILLMGDWCQRVRQWLLVVLHVPRPTLSVFVTWRVWCLLGSYLNLDKFGVFQELHLEFEISWRSHMSVEGFLTAGVGELWTFWLFLLLLDVVDQFEDGIFGHLEGLLLLIPVWDSATQVDALDLLHVCPRDVSIWVVYWFDAKVVHVDRAQDVWLDQLLVLLCVGLVAQSRDDELVLTWLTAFYVILCIEEGSVGDKIWHLEALVHDLEVTIVVDGRDDYSLVVCWEYLVLVLKVLNELFWKKPISFYFSNRQWCVVFPLLMQSEAKLLVFEDNWDLPLLLSQKVDGLVQELLL